MTILTDTALIFGRSFTNTRRSPVWIAIGLFQPLLYMLLFMPLLSRLEADPLATFTPGLLVMCALNTFASAGFGLIPDLRAGVIERLRVTPVSRAALLAGMLLNDLLVLLAQALLLAGLAFALGLRLPAGGLAGTLILVLLGGAGMTALSYALALAIRDENGLASVTNTFFLPLLLLSGVLLPLTDAPSALKILAFCNPFSYIVTAARLLCDGGGWTPAVWGGFLCAVLVAAAGFSWAMRCFLRSQA